MRFFFFKLFLLCLVSTGAFASALPESVTAALKRAHIPLSGVSILVQQTSAPKPLISLNADRAINPASTMKLLTTIASLETLGPAYRWKTEAYLDGKLENGVLQGDLVFKGYGDPKLTIEQFWLWMHELRQRGLREIRGDIVLDHSYFETTRHDPGKFDHDPTRAYNVGPNALLLNFNAIHLHLIPDGRKTRALIEPDLAGYTVVNRITTSRRLHCGGEKAYQAHLVGNDIVLEGSMPADCGEEDDYFSLLPQDKYFFAVFSALWKELGGTVQGKLRDGVVPAGAVPYSRYVSPPLAEVIRDINKFSNNTMARQLFLTLGMAGQTDADRGSLLSAGSKDNRGDFLMPQALVADSLQARQEGGDAVGPEDAITSTPDSTQQDGNEISGNPQPSASGIAAAAGAPPGANIALSIAVIRQWLATQQLHFPELVLDNGAGLSRKARISARHIAELLQRVMNSPYHAELESSLPILGIDGTVKKRFRDSDMAGYAHLKTGTLDGVKSIAGYVRAHDGRQWIVVFIVNNRNAALAEPAQNALIEWLQMDAG
ncbi:MAG TPA: D-alanyl-D-alanine carboxypeptidase/D-alanyl-D-alanine-endopeptidase [Gallionella sp.]|nr:D-alanyl-D-alanine carboxypeptidase/D-alanyl-D-alanine-endopeptidase [Gallionella sp.]